MDDTEQAAVAFQLATIERLLDAYDRAIDITARGLAPRAVRDAVQAALISILAARGVEIKRQQIGLEPWRAELRHGKIKLSATITDDEVDAAQSSLEVDALVPRRLSAAVREWLAEMMQRSSREIKGWRRRPLHSGRKSLAEFPRAPEGYLDSLIIGWDVDGAPVAKLREMTIAASGNDWIARGQTYTAYATRGELHYAMRGLVAAEAEYQRSRRRTGGIVPSAGLDG